MCGQNGLRNLMVPAEENPDQLYRPCAFCHTFPHGTTSNQVRVHYIRCNLLYKHTPVKTMWSEPDRCRSLTVNLSVTVTLACYVTASCRSGSYVPRLSSIALSCALLCLVGNMCCFSYNTCMQGDRMHKYRLDDESIRDLEHCGN